MMLEWVKAVGPILVSWPVVGLIAIWAFRKPLLALLEDARRFKFGGFESERVIAWHPQDRHEPFDESRSSSMLRAVLMRISGRGRMLAFA
jgi:hypothetical protein